MAEWFNVPCINGFHKCMGSNPSKGVGTFPGIPSFLPLGAHAMEVSSLQNEAQVGSHFLAGMNLF